MAMELRFLAEFLQILIVPKRVEEGDAGGVEVAGVAGYSGKAVLEGGGGDEEAGAAVAAGGGEAAPAAGG